MQKSTASGSHGTGVVVGKNIGEGGMLVAVSAGATDKVATGAVAMGVGAQAARMKITRRKTETRFINFSTAKAAKNAKKLFMFFFATLAVFAVDN
jgi:hypothetical protein